MLTAASEDAQHDPVDQADLQEWADYFDLSFPVLADPGAEVDRRYDPDRKTRPTYVLLAPGREILSVGKEYDEDQLVAALPGG